MKATFLSMVGLALLLAAYTDSESHAETDNSTTQESHYTADRYLGGKLTVGSVKGGKKSKPLFPRVSNDDFEAALRDFLETTHLLSEQPSADYTLDAELIEFKKRPTGNAYIIAVHSKIRYILTDAESREVLLDEVISARGTATARDAFRGTKRERIANERSTLVNISKIVDHLYQYDPNTGTVEYTPDKAQLWNRFEEREKVLADKDYDTWLKMLPPSFVSVAEIENPDGLRAMFDYYATDFEALEVLEICDCGEGVSPQGIHVTRCRTLTRMEPDGRGDAVNVLEMWQYENGAWFWGYTDHHPLFDCPTL